MLTSNNTGDKLTLRRSGLMASDTWVLVATKTITHQRSLF